MAKQALTSIDFDAILNQENMEARRTKFTKTGQAPIPKVNMTVRVDSNRYVQFKELCGELQMTNGALFDLMFEEFIKTYQK